MYDSTSDSYEDDSYDDKYGKIPSSSDEEDGLSQPLAGLSMQARSSRNDIGYGLFCDADTVPYSATAALAIEDALSPLQHMSYQGACSQLASLMASCSTQTFNGLRYAIEEDLQFLYRERGTHSFKAWLLNGLKRNWDKDTLHLVVSMLYEGPVGVPRHYVAECVPAELGMLLQDQRPSNAFWSGPLRAGGGPCISTSEMKNALQDPATIQVGEVFLQAVLKTLQ